MTTGPLTLPCREVIVKRPRRARWLSAAAVAMVVLGLPFLAISLSWIGAIAAAASAGWLSILAARSASARRVGGNLTLDRGVLRLVDEEGVIEELRVDHIASGYEILASATAVLRLRDGAEVWIHLPRAEAGAAARIIDYAKVGPTERALTMPLRRLLGAFTIGVMSFAAGLWIGALIAGYVFAPLTLVVALAITVLMVGRFGYPRVVVGTDGIRILGVLRPRFIPHGAIARAVALPSGHHGATATSHVRLDLCDGSQVILPTVVAPSEQVEGLARRINDTGQAREIGRARGIDALSRGDRSVSEWRKDVARIAIAEPGFRQNAVARDDFERVLRDAAAPIDQRVGAALALRIADPEGARERIRVVGAGEGGARSRRSSRPSRPW